MLKRLAQFAALGLSLAILPACGNAQRGAAATAAIAVAPRAMNVPVAVPATHAVVLQTGAAHPALHTGAPSGVHLVAPHHPLQPAMPRAPVHSYAVSGHAVYANGPLANDSFGDGGYPVTGLGFDYVHYAAVHPNAYRPHFRAGGIVPFLGGGGLYVPVEYYGESAPVAEQSEEAVAEKGPADLERPDSASQVLAAPVREHSAASIPSAPTPEFIFVRRDGTVFFAVAYSWVNGSLQYITQDGLRKIAALTTLDLDATSQFNEQRGVSFRHPA
jgi:hypothetical protein